MNKSLLESLLDYYGITYEEYLLLNKEVNLSNFRSGHEFDSINEATSLVNEVIAKKGKIIIYGDYDCDGIMGTSILVKMFEYLDVVSDYYIPSRYIDGYGLNLAHAKEYVSLGYDLVITVDNGITAFEAIEYLHNNGVKVLVLDHHQASDVLPLADAICHPIVSHFGDVASSGAFTAFIFATALIRRVDKYLALLASISVISDMMPLKEYNRYLLQAMFKEYKVGEFLPIDLLADNEQIDEVTIGMKIAPRINSIGRIIEDQSVNKIIKYFTTNDKDFILNYFSFILETNENRKNYSKVDITTLGLSGKERAIIIKGDYKEGIIGLVANSVMVKYGVPVVVFTKSIDNSLKGSARAPEGYDIVEAFNEVNSLLLTSGGHSSAAGCSIKEEDFEIFKEKFTDAITRKPIKAIEHKSIDIKMNDLSFENYELIKSFSPFGEGWPVPLLKIKHIKVDQLMYSKDHKHIITTLGNNLKLVFFNYPADLLANFKFIDIVGTLDLKSYRGNTYLEFSGKELFESLN